MKTLSYTQEYFLCAMNSKANAPFSLNPSFPACLIVGGVMELLDNGYIARSGEDSLVAAKEWDNGRPYLKPLYETVMTLRRANDVKGIIGVYLSVLSKRRFDELYSEIGASLAESGCADDMAKYGLSKKRTKYVPKAEAVKTVIDRVRAEIAGSEPLAGGTVCLLAFLEKSSLMRSYFSRVDAVTRKNRIDEVRKSEAYAFLDKVLSYNEGNEIAAMYFSPLTPG